MTIRLTAMMFGAGGLFLAAAGCNPSWESYDVVSRGQSRMLYPSVPADDETRFLVVHTDGTMSSTLDYTPPPEEQSPPKVQAQPIVIASPPPESIELLPLEVLPSSRPEE